eukprot:2441808-Prymnesium_polylepis.2
MVCAQADSAPYPRRSQIWAAINVAHDSGHGSLKVSLDYECEYVLPYGFTYGFTYEPCWCCCVLAVIDRERDIESM